MIPWWWVMIAFCLGIGTGTIVWAVSYRAATRDQDESATHTTEAEFDRRLDQKAREFEE